MTTARRKPWENHKEVVVLLSDGKFPTNTDIAMTFYGNRS